MNNAKKFYEGREKIIEGFKNEIFPIHYDEEERFRNEIEKEQKNIRDKNGLIDYNRLAGLIDIEKRGINDELIKKHFQVQDLKMLLKKLKSLKMKKMKFR